MHTEKQITGLVKLGEYIAAFLEHETNAGSSDSLDFQQLKEAVARSKAENSWFTEQNQYQALRALSSEFKREQIHLWLEAYEFSGQGVQVGLILAGNIPLVGFHDVLCVLLSGNKALIKLSSKDKRLIPVLLEKWQEFTGVDLAYEFVERLEDFDAVIATGSNNTSRYLEQYFKAYPHIIRKNRTSVAVLSGRETSEELKALSSDIFSYFGLGCRNVSKLFIPRDFLLDRLFESFVGYGEIINHHSYANNYDYHKAIYLMNQEQFWDNNFVMLKEQEALFSPLGVVYFSRYENLSDLEETLERSREQIQCVVSSMDLSLPTVRPGQAQCPSLSTYADNVDTMEFLAGLTKGN